MKICVLSTALSDMKGGVQQVVLNQSKELVRRGHEVVAITNHTSLEPYDTHPLNDERYNIDGVDVIATVYGFYEIVDGEAFAALADVMDNLNPDVFIGHLAPTEQLYPFIRKRKRKKDSIILHYQHGDNYLLSWRKTEYADGFIAVSQKVADDLRNGGELWRHSIRSTSKIARLATTKPIFVVPNGVDTDKFEFRNMSEKPSNRILFVGRVTIERGADILIDAVRLLKAEIPNIHIDFVGSFDDHFLLKHLFNIPLQYKTYLSVSNVDRALRDKLVKMGGNNITISSNARIKRIKEGVWEITDISAGYRVIEEVGVHLSVYKLRFYGDDFYTFHGNQKEVLPFLNSAGIFVLPSLSEGMPITLLEATSVGVPSIVTPVGNMNELTDKGVGLCVPVGDVQQLSRSIEKLLVDNELYQNCVTHCKRVRSEISWSHSVDKLLEAIGNIKKQ